MLRRGIPHRSFGLIRELQPQMRPEFKGALEQSGFEVVGSSPEEFAKFLRDELTKWNALVKANKIKVD